ncbi:LOW QUALITY PROTEIN: tRNA (adenine(58)-N(1))-methyltransferase, mitochondrial [Eublepharis macularius]|uniref:tRNA (adenine(58)-N(1))-methyltransferase n=1 Tax=Eublepharis macularius TaxID=481883 RepID=A0AA97J511_EUBMA|nr:LOW QUALITY PROTEIN: tRNA (adenine(58)-N(1))-methyltransferase, mitochondrial [Eublepharis macularius]
MWWRKGQLGLRVLRGETWAAVMSQARRKQAPREDERTACSFQGRLAKICGSLATSERLAKYAAALPALGCPPGNRRLFSSSGRNGDGGESEGQADPPVSVLPVVQRASAHLTENRRKRAWEKSLSPLERVSRLVPEEFLSEEISALRSTEAKESKQELCVKEEEPSLFSTRVPQAQSHLGPDLGPEPLLHTVSKNIPFQLGELILAVSPRRRHSDYRKLCKLTSGGLLTTTWGAIPYEEILGKLPGQFILTSTGQMFLIRRPALEDYVLLMKRGPTISYPKDMNAMLLLMDISQGDIVLEAGSGSGAMSLFLSRAVGPQGHVISYEIRKDHHIIAKTNYQNWRASWEIGHTVVWPDNVEFINEDISTAAEGLKMKTFDAIALDMVIPQNVLTVIASSLKQGGVCAVYVANITQVIDLLEAVRTSKSTLFCEKVVEVTHRDWLVHPVMQKYGTTFQHMKSKGKIVNEPTCHNEDEELYAEQNENDVFVSDKARPPYIARPRLWQIGHTVFLVKLRKFNSPNPNTAQDDVCCTEDCILPELHK